MELKQVETVVSDTANKLRLENTFIPELRSIFAALLADFRASVRAIGQVPDARAYEARFRAALQTQYTRTQRRFRGAIGVNFEDNIDALIDFALLEWRDNNAEQKARLITQTNQNQMSMALDMGRESVVEDPSPNALALASTAVLTQRFFARRPNLIAQTETQEAAEATKQIEAEATAGRAPFPVRQQVIMPTVPEVDVTKTWETVGDDRVRPAHVAVNGTTLSEDGVFIVGGSRLRFPGDTGLGASVGVIINCRCSSIYGVA